jgi:hypothetical protein
LPQAKSKGWSLSPLGFFASPESNIGRERNTKMKMMVLLAMRRRQQKERASEIERDDKKETE